MAGQGFDEQGFDEQGFDEQAVVDAVLAVAPVRAVLAMVVGEAHAQPVVALRVTLPPALGLPDVVRAIDQVRTAVAQVAPRARAFVEPDLAVDPEAPTEAIVIRALE